MSRCFSQVFRFDPDRSIKLLPSKIENLFLPSMVRFYPGRHTITRINSKVSINAAAPASPYKHLLEQQRNVLVSISCSSCVCNGGDVGLLIKTGSIQKGRMMTQTTIRNF